MEDLTLLEGLQLKGGGANALIRHAVAAVLNAASPDVDFAFDVATIVADVNAALMGEDDDEIEDLKDELADANESGCPLGRDE